MKRFLSILCAALWGLSLLGCAPRASAPAEDPAPTTLRWYIHFNWYNTPFGGNAVSRAITQATGTEIQFVSPGGTESVTLDTLIAGDDLPDLITLGWWEPQLQKIVDGGMVYALNELADAYCPAFWEAADADRLSWHAQPDGTPTATPTPPTPPGTTRRIPKSAPTRPSWSARTSTRPSALPT